jgi:HIRAN domain
VSVRLHRVTLARIACVAVLACATALFAQQRAQVLSSRAEILVQVSLAAGLRHHEAKAVWEQMKVGDSLHLVREPDNPYDLNAIRVEWNGHKLGYVPRAENDALARQMDRGNRLEARITKLTKYRNHRRKLEFEVYLGL